MSAVNEGHAGSHGGHSKFLAHHFGSMREQFEAGKLGMWIFLVTEVLFFGGLFCAYTVYRVNHPEVFDYAHHFLDKKLGALNTIVLIISSFTIAWAIRAVQKNQRKGAVILLTITLLCAGTFMVVKYLEYSHKFHAGLLWGENFQPSREVLEEVFGLQNVVRPPNVHIFFGIYFCMTALHGIHVLIGMGVILWMILRTARGDFGPDYFGPVEFTGLYWHLVDLIWIYLFPLLYLIA